MLKILVVRFSSIGDIVLTSPVLRCLKDQLEEVELHYLTKNTFLNLVNPNPHLTKCYGIEKEITEVGESLKAENYDYVIDLHNNLRTQRLKGILKVKSFSFPKLNTKKFLLTQFKIDKMPDLHVVDRYFEAINKLGVKNDKEGLEFHLNKDDNVEGLPQKFLAIAAGAKFFTKRMPLELLKEVVSNISTSIIILGGDADVEIGQRLEKVAANVVSYCGKLSIGQSAFVLSKASTVLTADTGLMHITTAFKRPIVSVWGNTTPAFGMYPYMPLNNETCKLHEVKLKCRPCSKIGYDKCPKVHFNCMKEQNSEAIITDIKELLKK